MAGYYQAVESGVGFRESRAVGFSANVSNVNWLPDYFRCGFNLFQLRLGLRGFGG